MIASRDAQQDEIMIKIRCDLLDAIELNSAYIRIANEFAKMGSLQSMIIVRDLFKDRMDMIEDSRVIIPLSAFEKLLSNASNGYDVSSGKVREYKDLYRDGTCDHSECQCLQQIAAHVAELGRTCLLE
jgi:hypothetical protein